MAQSLDQVMQSLDPYYSGSRNIVQTQLNALPGETQASIDQADAKLSDANDSILAGARQRGLGFSGIPVGEQAKYAATEYAPAIANLKSSQNTKQLSLMDTLNGLNRDQRTSAQSIYDQGVAQDLAERQFNESIRQFNENLAAQKAAQAAAQANIGAYLGGGGSGSASAAPASANISRNSGGGFNFSDSAGKPITAAQYSQLTGVGFKQLLTQMAQSGDSNAKIALQYMKSDGTFAAPKQYAGALGALGANATYVTDLSKPVTIQSGKLTLPSIFNG